MNISEMKEKIVFKLDHKGAILEASGDIICDECGKSNDKPPKKIDFYNDFHVVMAEKTELKIK